MKDIKKLLKQQSENILPDSSVKESVKRDLGIYPQREARAVYSTGDTTAVRKHFSITLWVAVALAVILIATAVIMSVQQVTVTPPYVSDKFDTITTADSFYAYGATSIGALLTVNTDGASAGIADAMVSLGRGDGNNARPTDSQLETINGYMLLVEQLLSDQGITESVRILEGQEYAYSMEVTFTDLLGNETSYTMMYDRIAIGSENDEQNYAIQGELHLGDEVYLVEGKYETESDTEETESEMWFKAFLNGQKTDFIEVEQETEQETEDNATETETEYSYTLYTDGKPVYSTTVSYEKEGNETELEMVVKQNGKEDVISFKEEIRNGAKRLRVEGRIDGADVEFEIEIHSDGGEGGSYYRYRFGDGSYKDMGRGH